MPVLTTTDAIMTHLRDCVARRDRWVFLGGCSHGHSEVSLLLMECLLNGVDPSAICRAVILVSAGSADDDTGTVSVLTVPKAVTPSDWTTQIAAAIDGHAVRGGGKTPGKDFLCIACNDIDASILDHLILAVLEPARVRPTPETPARSRAPIPSAN